MRIDVNAFVGAYPFRRVPGTSPEALLAAMDRTGLDESAPAKSWNSSHPSRGPGGGCSQDDLKSTGGNGLLYCFATN